MAFCASHSLDYICVDFISANRMLINHLETVGNECRQALLSDMLNLRG
jgi:hypothetical protein